MTTHAAFCADVGSIVNHRFGWAADIGGDNASGTDIREFADAIAEAIGQGHKVSVGFECPLFVPARELPEELLMARDGDGGRAWSAGAGTGAMATGMVEVLWVLREIRVRLEHAPALTFDWHEWRKADAVLLWEAFVTGSAKGTSHVEDARLALDKFLASLRNLDAVNAVAEPSVFSLVGACALRAGWSDDVELLSTPCLVVRV